jgi:chemotaxis protein methyltransferase CheR
LEYCFLPSPQKDLTFTEPAERGRNNVRPFVHTTADTMSESRTYIDTRREMTAEDFERLSHFIYNHCGIKMPPIKITMLESRLQKRLRALGVSSFRDYCDFIFKSPDGSNELVEMIDAVTTNKTDFFREPDHFSFLSETVLPEFMQGGDSRMREPFTIWSSACSSGEEPYTLALVMSEFKSQNSGFKFTVMATDISTKVLDKAKAGIYDENQISMIPLLLKRKYFLRSKDRTKGQVRVGSELRSNIVFQRLNLMDYEYPMRVASLDAIFCRNVIIYFDRRTQGALLNRLCRYIKRDGYLFLGHSETIHGFDLPLIRMASTIYRKVV